MPHKDKAAAAQYMRDYRARQAADLGARATRPSSQDPRRYKPAFLAAPIDTCPLCHHDRQEADHLGGRPCKFKNGRRSCGCTFEGF